MVHGPWLEQAEDGIDFGHHSVGLGSMGRLRGEIEAELAPFRIARVQRQEPARQPCHALGMSCPVTSGHLGSAPRSKKDIERRSRPDPQPPGRLGHGKTKSGKVGFQRRAILSA